MRDFFFIFKGRDERLGRLVQGEREVVIRMGKVGERKVYGRGNMEEGRRMKGGRREIYEEKRKRGGRGEMNKENRKRGGEGENEVEERYMKRKGREEEGDIRMIGGSWTGRCWRGLQWGLWQCPGLNSRHL